MKNILKKIGVIGLIIAVLAPFIDITKVKAANDETCTSHIQTFLFLDVNYGIPEEYEDGYQTYTHFPFEFDTNLTYKNVDVEINDITARNDEEAMEAFWLNYNSFVQSNRYVSKNTNYSNGSTLTTKDDTYDTSTILWHGDWARFNEESDLINPVYGQVQIADQRTLQQSIDASNMDTKIYGAKFEGEEFDTDNDQIDDDYIVNILNDLDAAIEDNRIWYDGDAAYIPLSIKRTIRNFDATMEGLTFGYVYDNHYYAFTSDIGNGVVDSYNAWRNHTNESRDDIIEVDSESEIDINTGKAYYWPAVMNITYQTCSSTPVNSSKWTLKYDGNATGVKNIPKGGQYDIKQEVTVAEGPTLEGQSFREWCIDPDGETGCYKPGDKITSSTSATVTLYAQWGAAGTESTNPPGGVFSYIIGFMSVGAIAGAIYLVSKKKNLFKQI